MDKKSKGIMYMVFSAFCFAIMGALVKLSGDLPTFEKVFFRNFVSLFVALSMAIYHKNNLFGKRENQKYLMARSVLGTIGMIFYFYCIDNMVLADSSMLNKMHPFFVTIFAVIFLKDKLTKVQIPALILAFLGTLFIVKPQFNIEVLPAIVGVLSAAFAGAAYTFVSFLRDKEKHYTIVFYFSLVSTLIALPFMLMNYKPINLTQLAMLIGAGIAAANAQFALTIAYKYAPAGEISIYNYTNVVFSGIIGVFLWCEVPDMFSLLGYILIIGAGTLIFIYNKKMKKIRGQI